jgi:hypothetical protein
MSRRDPMFIDLPDLRRPRRSLTERLAGLIAVAGPGLVTVLMLVAFVLVALHTRWRL